MIAAAFVVVSMLVANQASANHHEQYIMLSKYNIANIEQHAQVDTFLKNAFLPSLQRYGLSNIGVFEAHDKKKDGLHIWLVVPFDSLDQYAGLNAHLTQDSEFHDDAGEYLFLPTKKDRAFERLESTLMKSFTGWPKVTKAHEGDKIYELRDYESFSEYKAYMKVAMFNNGEIDIFNKTGLDGIFFGNVIAGKNMPNLIYMASYKDMDERNANWKKFLEHPDWTDLKSQEQYKQTVSKIYQTFLVAKPYSQI